MVPKIQYCGADYSDQWSKQQDSLLIYCVSILIDSFLILFEMGFGILERESQRPIMGHAPILQSVWGLVKNVQSPFIIFSMPRVNICRISHVDMRPTFTEVDSHMQPSCLQNIDSPL